MAGPSSGSDHPAGLINGAIEGQQKRIVPATRVREDDEMLVDTEQTLSDSDQTLSDTDQTSSESDQTSSDSDQLAADRDQDASDHDLKEFGGNPHAHEVTRDIRRRTARQREQTSQARMDAAHKRDEIADTRDGAALARDQAADARDLAVAQRDAVYQQDDGLRAVSGAEVVVRAAAQRKRAVQQRAHAAEQRLLAAQDRQSAAHDREQGAVERRRSLVDREMFARQLVIAEMDPSTGARTRAVGLSDLDRELDRCRDTGGLLVVAYVDVVGLKTPSDSDGAGDALLKHVVANIREHLRSFDLIIRLGGDEFLCAMSNMTLQDARQRLSVIAAALAGAPTAAAITVGFAEFAPGETSTELIARADSELIDRRRANY